MNRSTICFSLCTAAILLSSQASAVVTIDWVTVGSPLNFCDTSWGSCVGAVDYPYEISKFEVTNTQYAEFLNAVAATDTHALYNTDMGNLALCCITRSGSSGSFSYSVIAGREDKPVVWVSFWDAARFANWLHNGQPTGAQDHTTTEDGAYTLAPTGITNNTVTRNPSAVVFIPSDDEWYKAAYYDGITVPYYGYPAGSNTTTTCAAPGATPNTANCNISIPPNPSPGLTDVGSYTGAASPSGTFDQGGNVYEWIETITGGNRGQRGGDWVQPHQHLQSGSANSDLASAEGFASGFRLASIVPGPLVQVFHISGTSNEVAWSWRIDDAVGSLGSATNVGPVTIGGASSLFKDEFIASINARSAFCEATNHTLNRFKVTCVLPFAFFVANATGSGGECLVTGTTLGGGGCAFNPTIVQVAPTPDFDFDGVADGLDNCLEVPNPDQVDTDFDQCGNKCDADYDQSGTPDGGDFGAFAFAFGTSDEQKCHTGPIPGCTVDGADFGFFAFTFGVPPGPSGTTGGTTACP